MRYGTAFTLCMCLFGAVISGCATQPPVATTYDGHWTARIAARGTCPPAYWQFDVKNHKIKGTVTNPSGTYALSGTIGNSGKGMIRINRMGGNIQFSGGQFESNYFNGCGARHASGFRSPRGDRNSGGATREL